MGGLGSGRPPGMAGPVVESVRSIDANALHTAGAFCSGVHSTVRWQSAGEVTSVVRIEASDGQLRLLFRGRFSDAEWQELSQTIFTCEQSCHFGGRRTYFLCPGRNCNRQVVKLYFTGSVFRCRHCCGLTYSCQREQPWDRSARRANKIRHRLGGSLGIFTPFPEKPKGMWWRTYGRLADQAFEAADTAEQVILGRRHSRKGA